MGEGLKRAFKAARKSRARLTVGQLSSAQFTFENGAQRNGVFLWENHDEAPYLRPVEGWKVVGWTKQAPWPGISNGFAVMLEKVTPAVPERDAYRKWHLSFGEGTRIWQHLEERNFKELTTNPTPDKPTH